MDAARTVVELDELSFADLMEIPHDDLVRLIHVYVTRTKDLLAENRRLLTAHLRSCPANAG